MAIIQARTWLSRSFSTLSSHPLRVCVVGSGPAGFYTAEKVNLSLSPSQKYMLVCMYVIVGLVPKKVKERIINYELLYYFSVFELLRVCEQMLKAHQEAQVDIIDRLPTPFGLVRSGVAPDHPETKVKLKYFNFFCFFTVIIIIG